MNTTMKCDWCGKEFPADARACVDVGFDAEWGDTEAWKDEPPPGHIVVGDGERERLKSEMGLDDKQLDELLLTGTIKGLGAIICIECQDEAIPEEQ